MKADIQRISDYEIKETIGETRKSIIYRAQKVDSDHTVIIKLLKAAYPSPSEIARFKQEYKIVSTLEIDNIVKTLDLVEYKDSYAIIEEDFGGVSLKEIIQSNKKINIKSFLQIAIKISSAMAELHKNNIIHKDIKPGNILLNLKSGIVKITDFGISAVITHENDEIYNPEVVQGTLTYMSPEQTGRMNREVDYRSDLYSLGITLYETLTGSQPFNSKDPMELIHSHIARQPVPPKDINSSIPAVLSDIILKLISKNPEGRYQNSLGLMADLAKCLQQLKTTGKISSFPIAAKDISMKFHIPHLLVGRDNEIKMLMESFNRMSTLSSYHSGRKDNSGVEIMLVSGNPGIGKSALINEIHKPIVARKGYFIFGKYDQLRKDVPYSSIIQAFQGLVRQIISESEERLSLWQKELREALNPNGKVITDVIPDLEHIIGPQPDVPELGPEESQNRFNLVFQNFINVFTREDHPLVLFLDDLQWADSASLNLLKIIIINPDINYLLLIGAFRDNEVSEYHPLMITLEEISKNGVAINTLHLEPLHIEAVNKLVASVLRCDESTSYPLAEIIQKKTRGNPFFVNQFFKTLYDRKIITLDPAEGWEWDIDEISNMDVTDNVVELLAGKISNLPQKARDMLEICACIGNRFDLETLSHVSGRSINETLEDLTEAINEGLIGIQGDLYKFSHDRIQEAAYSLFTETDRARTHHKIGKTALDRTTEKNLMDKIFYIVDQLNSGRELITEQDEEIELARLNLMAGEKAKSSTAYASAVTYYSAGMKLLPDQSWKINYEMSYALYKGRMESEYLNLNFDKAVEIFELLIKNARINVHKANIYSLMIILYTSRGNYEEALRLGHEGMRLVGIKFPKKVSELRLGLELLKMRITFGRKKIEDILDIPLMNDPEIASYFYLAIHTGTVAYYTDANLFSAIVVRSCRMLVKYGNNEISPFAFNAVGSIIGAGLGFYSHSFRFGETGLKLIDQFNFRVTRGRSEFLFPMFIQHWIKHARHDLVYFREAYKHGMETGDLIYCGHSINLIGMTRIMLGDNIDEILGEYGKYENFQKGGKDPFVAFNYIENTQMCLCLKDMTNSRGSLNNDHFNDDEQVNFYRNEGNMLGLFYFLLVKIRIHFLFRQYTRCIDYSLEMDQLAKKKVAIGNLHIPELYFYYSLAMAAHYPDAGTLNKIKFKKSLKKNQKKMKKWAAHCPENYLHKYLLIEAERAMLAGKSAKAAHLYDEAIVSAHENSYTQNEAIANDRAAVFWMKSGNEERAAAYIQKAHYCYQRWGAVAKCRDLEEIYPQYNFEKLKDVTPAHDGNDSTVTGDFSKTGMTTTSTLDINTAMQTTQALSSEIELGSLLENVMKLAIENAGAQHGFLILEKEDDNTLYIEAEGKIDQKIEVLKGIPLESSKNLATTIVNYVKKTGENLVLNDAQSDERFVNDPYIIENNPNSILCAPIRHKGKLSGIVYLENDLTTYAFTPERIQLLQMLSTQAAISIENSRLIAHREHAAELQTEMKIAAEIQSALLPDNPAIEGYDITAFMRPADDVGGDYYDVINSDNLDWVIIGDVSGHGVPAGLIMMMVQTSIQAYLRKHPEVKPSELLSIVNEAIRYNVVKMDLDKYMTITAISLASDGMATFSGLHQDMLVYRAAGSEVEIIESQGIWLSPWDLSQAAANLQFSLHTGDTLLLYTDGITEAKDIDGNMFSDEKLVDLLRNTGKLSCEEIKDAVLDELAAYNTNDDVTMVLLKKH